MDFWQVIRNRHSVRAFDTQQQVSDTMVEGLLSAAIEAPSAGNRQSWRFFVVRRAATRKALAEAALGQDFVAQAPVVIAVCADPQRSARRYGARGSSLYTYQDTAAATQNLLLAATELGLGACWVGAFDTDAVARALEAPEGIIPVALVPVGYPLQPSERTTTRRDISEVTTYIE